MAASPFRRVLGTVGLSVAFTLAAYAPAMLAVRDGAGVAPTERVAVAGQRAWIGIDLGKGTSGAVIAKRVLRGSPAEAAGVMNDDELVSLDGTAITSGKQLIETVQSLGAGKATVLKVKRGGAEKALNITIGAHPGDEEVLKRDKVGTFATAIGGKVVTPNTEEDLSKLKGRVVLIDFWATWCSACKAAAPALSAINDKYGAQGLTVLGATADASDAAEKTAKDLGVTYGIIGDVSQDVIDTYSVRSLPTMFLIDKTGVIRDVLVGFSDQKTIDAAVSKLVAERSL